MTLDPTTPEGRKEAVRRAKKVKKFAEEMRELANQNPDEEPSGKITRPCETDLFRDRKGDVSDD